MAPPVSRDGFFYDSQGLFVRPEGATCAHHRREASSLYALLTYKAPNAPILTKKDDVAKRQPRSHKDEPVHFYIAQLALYGLKLYKTKDAAKKHLLAAFKDDKTLPVLPEILQLERELKEEYAMASKIAADADRVEKAERERSQLEAITRQNEAIDEVEEDFTEDIHEVEEEEAATSAVGALLSGLSSEELVLLITRLVVSSPSLMDELEDEVEVIRLEGAPPPARIQQTVKKRSARLYDPDLHEPIAKRFPRLQGAQEDNTTPAAKPIAARKHGRQTARKSTGGKAPRAPRVALKLGKPSTSRTKKSLAVSWSELVPGSLFEVTVPYLEQEWPDYVSHDGFYLELCSSSTRSHLWGSFDFGMVSGVFRTDVPPPAGISPGSNASFTTSFKWRGSEQGEGQLIFGDGNTGTLTFSNGGSRIKGVISGSFLGKDQAKFTGTAGPSIGIRESSIKEWKAEWRGINQDAYNAANRARWGGWGGDSRPERPAASDTSGSGHDDESDALEDGREDVWDAY